MTCARDTGTTRCNGNRAGDQVRGKDEWRNVVRRVDVMKQP
jgi:hypothetical protein